MLYEFKGLRPNIDPTAYISPEATIIGAVTIGAQCYVGPGAVIRADEKPVVLLERSVVEDGAIIHGGGRRSGTTIGPEVTIGHGAIVHSERLHEGSAVGMGAVLSLDSVLEPGAIVAEGAVVKSGQTITRDTVAGGVPAKPLRPVSQADKAAWKANNRCYVELARDCLEGALRPLEEEK